MVCLEYVGAFGSASVLVLWIVGLLLRFGDFGD